MKLFFKEKYERIGQDVQCAQINWCPRNSPFIHRLCVLQGECKALYNLINDIPTIDSSFIQKYAEIINKKYDEIMVEYNKGGV